MSWLTQQLDTPPQTINMARGNTGYDDDDEVSHYRHFH